MSSDGSRLPPQRESKSFFYTEHPRWMNRPLHNQEKNQKICVTKVLRTKMKSCNPAKYDFTSEILETNSILLVAQHPMFSHEHKNPSERYVNASILFSGRAAWRPLPRFWPRSTSVLTRVRTSTSSPAVTTSPAPP